MKRNKIILIALILSMTALLFTGCWLTPLSPDNEPLETIIPETTIVLEEETNGQIFSVAEDHSIITFSESTPQVEELAPGHILAMGVTEKTPEGLLRRITKISKGGRDNNQVIVETESTTLEEAIDQGEFCFNESLNAEDAKEPVCYVKGIEFVRDRSILKDSKIQVLEFNYNINAIIYDADNNPETKADNVTLSGQISFDYNLLFSCKIQFPNKLKELNFQNSVKIDKNLGVTVGASIKAFSQETSLWKQSLGSKVIMVGCIPVVLSPEITIVANVNGELSARVTAQVTKKDNYTAGIQYTDGSWQSIKQHEKTSSTFVQEITGDADIMFGVGPKLECKIEGVMGPYIEVLVYGEAKADTSDNPWWKIYAGLLAKAGIKVEIFSKVLTSTELTILDIQEIIAEADGPFINNPPVISELSANPSKVYVGQSSVITSRASDQDSDSLTYTWTKTGGTFEGDATGLSIIWKAPSNEGNYEVSCEVSDGKQEVNKSVNISVSKVYAVYDTGPAGGFIFYDDEADGVDDIAGARYLEVAPHDQCTISIGAPWGCYGGYYGPEILGADGTAMGTGEQNTIDIEAECTEAGAAADICANFSLGGYDDWFLPSKDELDLMFSLLNWYNNWWLYDFSDDCYWSSSEVGGDSAWQLDFYEEEWGIETKNRKCSVRAIRAF